MKIPRSQAVAMLSSYYREAYARYRDAVLSGERVASQAERLKVERQERDLKEGVEGYVFDLTVGIKPLVWMAMNLAFPMGAKRGKPLRLSDWQAWDIAVLFGWIKPGKPQTRRFVDAFIEIARKNGKSTFAGALLDYLTFGEIEGARSYIGATCLEQADETFVRAADALMLVHKNKVCKADSKNNKVLKYKSGMIMAIASEPKDGKLAYGAVMDEYHQFRDNGLISSIRNGNVSDQSALLIRITTAGTTLNGVCHEEYDKCKRVLAGELSIPRYFISIYEIDDGDDVDDPAVWPKANPNMGISVDGDAFKAIYDYAKDSASDMVTFKTKNLNVWCHSLQSWANMPVWMERCHWTVEEAGLTGCRCYGGLDLSSNSDFTAFTLDFPQDDGRHLQITRCWVPEESVSQISRQCRIPLQRWIQEGLVIATPGPVIDYAYVVDYLNWCHDTYQLEYIAADRWKITELCRIMPPWFVDVAFEFSQGLKTMSPTIKDFERAYLEGKVSANGSEVIDWMMSCAELFQDTSGNVKLVKPKQRTSKRIDGVITSVMALATAMTHEEVPFEGDIDDLVKFG